MTDSRASTIFSCANTGPFNQGSTICIRRAFSSRRVAQEIGRCCCVCSLICYSFCFTSALGPHTSIRSAPKAFEQRLNFLPDFRLCLSHRLVPHCSHSTCRAYFNRRHGLFRRGHLEPIIGLHLLTFVISQGADLKSDLACTRPLQRLR